jgi:hypothetical protein
LVAARPQDGQRLGTLGANNNECQSIKYELDTKLKENTNALKTEPGPMMARPASAPVAYAGGG